VAYSSALPAHHTWAVNPGSTLLLPDLQLVLALVLPNIVINAMKKEAGGTVCDTESRL